MSFIGELKTTPLEWDKRFMNLALNVSTWSKDPKCKVGAIVVSNDKRRFIVGYNGFPKGVSDTRERLAGPTKLDLMLHAELNAIFNAGSHLPGWTLYVTKGPCIDCAKAIIQSGITRVVSPSTPSDSSWHLSFAKGFEIMQEAGLEITTLEIYNETDNGC